MSRESTDQNSKAEEATRSRLAASTEEKSRESDSEGREAPADHRLAQQSIRDFNTNIILDGGIVSLGLINNYDGAHVAMSGAVTGQMSETEIRAVMENPVRSATHVAAVEAVRVDRVVATFGPPGCGKTQGGSAVLVELKPQKIFVLTPGSSLDELALRAYQKDCAYLVEDVKSGSDRTASDAWRRVRTRVAERGAWLLAVTSDAERAETGEVETVKHLHWERPDLRRVLEARGLPSPTIDLVLAELPDQPAIRSVGRVAELVADGEEPAAVVQKVFGLAARAAVDEWFSNTPSRADICEITVLAMTYGLRLRDYGMCLLSFEKILDQHIPRPEKDKDEETADVLQPRRERMLRDEGLMTIDRVTKNGVASRQLKFKDPSYRMHVIRKLWDTYDERFWCAVHEWIHEVVLNDAVRFNVAVGLAMLAREAYDEVEPDYLLPWSKGTYGWKRQQAAIWVLSLMCTDSELSKTALETATQWVNYGSWPQRWTGAVAFTGPLGVRYPEQAARRIWQLVAQKGPISISVAKSMGQLFATLVAAEGKAGKVLALLQRRLTELSPQGREAGKYKLAMLAVLAVFSAKLPGDGKRAIVVLLLAKPELRPLICEVWAAAFRHTPARRFALGSLAQALHSLDKLSADADAERETAALGQQFRTELSPSEMQSLRQHLPAMMTRDASGQKRSSRLTEILLAALDVVATPRGSDT